MNIIGIFIDEHHGIQFTYYNNSGENLLINTNDMIYDNIMELTINICFYQNHCMDNISTIIQKFINLKKIKIIFSWSFVDFTELVLPIKQLKYLETISVDSPASHHSLVTFISEFLDKLDDIKLNINDNENLLIKIIDTLSNNNVLKHINICNIHHNEKKILHKILNLRNITELSLNFYDDADDNISYKNICDIIATSNHNLTSLSLCCVHDDEDLMSCFINSNIKDIHIIHFYNSTLRYSQKSLPELILTNKIVKTIRTNYMLNNHQNVVKLVDALKINDTLETLHLINSEFTNDSLLDIVKILNVNKTLKSIRMGIQTGKLSKHVIREVIKCLKNNHVLEQINGIIFNGHKRKMVNHSCEINKMINTNVNWQNIFFDKMEKNVYWKKNIVWSRSSKYLLLDFKKNVTQYLLCVKHKKYVVSSKYIKFWILDYMFFNYLVNAKLNL